MTKTDETNLKSDGTTQYDNDAHSIRLERLLLYFIGIAQRQGDHVWSALFCEVLEKERTKTRKGQ